jgi:S-adenosylmethionine synthetase
MPRAKDLLLGVVILGLVSGIVACAARSHGVVRVPRSYDEVFAASLAAIQDAEFTVASQERETGTIGAEKRLPSAEGDILRMTVRLTQESTGVTVVATVVPPTGPLATGEKPCKCHVKRFVEALEHRMPEVQVVTIH